MGQGPLIAQIMFHLSNNFAIMSGIAFDGPECHYKGSLCSCKGHFCDRKDAFVIERMSL